ncbi:MAG: type II toxin-antitoxin system RelE/ParE family toxin [Epsilonproteobacteria bacterium]|nr:type II toxin-antitoxin system RelE/ParE family toxin [Campylobacterota bacterium]
MNYDLEFHPKALEEWKKLDSPTKKRFKKKLVERLYEPKVEESKIKGMEEIYQITPSGSEYQLIYKVNEDKKTLLVLKIAKQDNIKIYNSIEEKEES